MTATQSDLTALQSENARLRAELERAKGDAERYRKLRHYCSPRMIADLFFKLPLTPKEGWSTEDWTDAIVDEGEILPEADIDAARGKG